MKIESKQAKNLLDEDLKEETAFDGWTYFGDKGEKNLKVPYFHRHVKEGVKEAWWLMSEYWAELLESPSLKDLLNSIMTYKQKGYIKKENVMVIDFDVLKTALNHSGVCELLAFRPNAHPHLKRYFLKEEAKAEPAIKYGNMQGKPSPELVEAFGRIKIPGLEKSESLPVPAPQSPNSITFWFDSKAFRTHIQPDNSKWFCAVDVCRELGYKDVEQAIKSHCLGKQIKCKPEGSSKDMLYVSEGDLNNLILRSDSPNALPFRRTVTEKILPEIIKLGKFIAGKEREERAFQRVAERSSQGEQLELFPIPSKPDLNFPKPVVETLSLALKHLANNGIGFKNHADFLGYLLEQGLDKIGLRGFTLNRNGEKVK